MIKNMLSRIGSSAAIGGGLGAGINALTGGDVRQGLKRGAFEGVSAAPLLAITNPITTKLIGSVAPGAGIVGQQLTSRGIGGLANAVEDQILYGMDGLSMTNREKAMSFAMGALMTGNKQVLDSLTDLAPQAKRQLLRNIDNQMRPVKTMKIDPRTGERVTLPLWKYQLDKQGFGLSTKDINELSPEDYAKVKAGGLSKPVKKGLRNAYYVSSGQKNEAVLLPKTIANYDVYLQNQTFKKILEKHADEPNFDFNSALQFVKTLHSPDNFPSLNSTQRVNYAKNLAGQYEGWVNKVGTKPINQLKKSYVTTSVITNKPREIKKFLSEGAPNPSSRQPLAGAEGALSASNGTNPIIPPKVKGVGASAYPQISHPQIRPDQSMGQP